MSLVFNEEALLSGNVFKYEQRLKSHVSKYIENGAILTTYYHLRDSAVTVDRGFRDIEQLFGRQSPLRFDRINNFPLYGFGQTNPTNNDDAQVEDITLDGECQIMMATIVPSQNDFFTVNHMSMMAIFQITDITYDSMKPDGYYRIRYRLQSTSQETMDNINRQTVGHYRCDLEAIGTDVSPIISEDDAVRKSQLHRMMIGMITDYRATYYNDRHNCFLLTCNVGRWPNRRWFDLCQNEFIAKHSLMNIPNSANVLILHHKLNDSLAKIRYQQSVYRWLEDDAPRSQLDPFPLSTRPAYNYLDSSFHLWGDDDIDVLMPAMEEECGTVGNVFNDEQIEYYRFDSVATGTNDFDNVMRTFIRGELNSIQQIPLSLGHELRYDPGDQFTFHAVPMAIYLLRHVLKLD